MHTDAQSVLDNATGGAAPNSSVVVPHQLQSR